MEKELSRIFRYFIEGGIKIHVNGRHELLPYDPLMLMESSWADSVLNKELKGKAKAKENPQHFPATEIIRQPLPIADGKVTLIMTLYPKEVVRKRGFGGDDLAKQLRVQDNQGAISFVRRQREVAYTNIPRIFGRAVEDADRFIGIEVQFNPELDDYFGVRNVKRGVEPHGELRRIIQQELQKYVPIARKRLEELWGAARREEQETEGEHSPVVEALKEVDVLLPQSRVTSRQSAEEVTVSLEQLALDIGADEAQRPALIERWKDLPFLLESVDFPGTMFMTTDHVGGKVIIRLNTRHRFYRELWEPIREIAERDPSTITGDEAARTAKRTIEALTLLLVAYGRAESMDRNPVERYEDLLNHWGQFLSTLLGKIKGVL